MHGEHLSFEHKLLDVRQAIFFEKALEGSSGVRGDFAKNMIFESGLPIPKLH